MITGYSFRFAFESLRKEFWINLIASLSAGIGLFILAIIALGFYNINLLTKRLPEKFTVVLYLKDLSKEEIDRAITDLKNNRMVKSVRFIPKDTALNELKKRLKDSSILVEGLEGNPLPDSVEIRLKPEYMKTEEIKNLISALRSMPGIDDIDYGEDIVASIVLIKKTVETYGIAFIALVMIGVVFNFYTTIKILFYRRKEEVETFKLLGASKGFIRIPFLIEGAIIGMAGALIASGLLLALYQALLFLSSKLPFISSLNIFSQILSLFIFLPCAGISFGIIGAFLGLGKIRY
jgi:cell division transport system permease protein